MGPGFDDELYRNWLRYYIETERYDRTMPGRMFNGSWRVMCGWESVSLGNARRTLKRLGLGQGNCAEKERAGTLSFERQVEELAAMTP
jgi:hypothetical protein